MEEKIKRDVLNIVAKRSGVDFYRHPGYWQEPLLGPKLQMPARELLYVYVDIEHLLGKPVLEEDIEKGWFDTAEHILACVERVLAQN